jgi:histone deacetylase 1/2
VLSHQLACSIHAPSWLSPTYATLRVFGCLCYPNVASTLPHKLSPRSMPSVFLGYPSQHRGYRCYNPVSGKILISRHVIFNEIVFPFQLAASQAVSPPPPPRRLDFLYVDPPPAVRSCTPAPTPPATAPVAPRTPSPAVVGDSLAAPQSSAMAEISSAVVG